MWYARACDTTISKTLSSIAGQQARTTEGLQEELSGSWIMYCSTHPDSTIRFLASDMFLALHLDGSHLSETGSKSRTAGQFYLTNKDDKDTNNGAVLALSKIINHVMEIESLFYNCKDAIPLRLALEEMGHPQPKTTTVTDSSTAEGLINKTMTPNRAKTYDFTTNWLKCREAQRQFDIMWKKGKDNRADYHSKDHPPHVHKGGEYLYEPMS